MSNKDERNNGGHMFSGDSLVNYNLILNVGDFSSVMLSLGDEGETDMVFVAID